MSYSARHDATQRLGPTVVNVLSHGTMRNGFNSKALKSELQHIGSVRQLTSF